jgi:DNA repair photolyase
MPSASEPIRGRGAADNPANRFDRLHYEPDPDLDPDDQPAPRTQFLRDDTRSIISTNDSPDVGFTASLNPYRGCEHGCAYCLSGNTEILLGDGTTRRLEDVRVGDEVYGTVRSGWYRRYVRTKVAAHWGVLQPAYRVKLGDGTCLVAGANHRFLTERGWKFVGRAAHQRRPQLTINNKLMGVGAFATPPRQNDDYKQGYLCGMVRGDGHLATYNYGGRRRSREILYQFRLALADEEALRRSARYLLDLGIPTQEFHFQGASETRRAIRAIRTSARASVVRIAEMIAWPDTPSSGWRKGFLAGIFDAEGCYSQGTIRIFNSDLSIINCVTDCLQHEGFVFVIEPTKKGCNYPVHVVRIGGGLREHLRFFHTTDPTIIRKRDIEGQAVKSSANLRVASVEPLGVTLPLFDITTGTGDFLANGVISHNCYARPTHEYLGFSAGLDFETRIVVKENAPALLHKELSSSRWTPQVLGLSGVTDPYQPIERRLGLTRRCLEILAEFRNPVAVVTKNRLVTRDADLLGNLAGHGAAAVFLSITTLDGDLARVLEPRAAQPAARLAALAELRRAGVPAGVLVAPVIPGINDHEIPAVLTAAAEAGARYAGYVLLRLPHGVADLFAAWLERHFPDRKDKVLGRIRDLRGGRLNDSRFGRRMRGQGVLAEQIKALFVLGRKRAGITGRGPELSTAAFRRPGGTQRLLFEE